MSIAKNPLVNVLLCLVPILILGGVAAAQRIFLRV